MSAGYELHFPPLGEGEPALAFPCDAAGRVDLDTLGAPMRLSYLYARALIGCAFGRPRCAPLPACESDDKERP